MGEGGKGGGGGGGLVSSPSQTLLLEAPVCEMLLVTNMRNCQRLPVRPVNLLQPPAVRRRCAAQPPAK